MNLDTIPLEALLRQRRSLKRTLLAEPGLKELRIAVLGGSTTNALVDLWELGLLADGFLPVFHQSEYGRYYEDAVLDPQPLVDFRPDIVYIYTSCLNLPPVPATATEATLAELAAEQLDHFQAIWNSLETHLSCQIIQNNFELPAYALLGNLEASEPAASAALVLELNRAFAQQARRRPRLLLQDVHHLAAHVGIAHWFDWDRYYAYKLLLTPSANFALARSLSAMVRALYGKARKVLILDLDNTLWGGVIGDDGVDSIQIGRETPLAEAYTAFQEYCLALRQRGILLAVCSKNTDAIARSGLEHPSSTLRMEHFSSFKANWSPKHENILAIAQELNLGLNSFVFVDDNPAERAIVEAQLPEVAVPDVGDEVSRFPAILDQARYFEPVSLLQEDLDRAALYAANTERSTLQAKFADYGEYLDSLKMTAEIDTFRPVYLERIAQLTNKTNQYNLTTRRYNLAEMQTVAASPRHIALYGRLIDRFGDNGLITVVAGQHHADALHIDLWLMSCRVLKRDMEFAMLDALVEHARTLGLSTLYGIYLPTPKNAMVADHYQRLGFTTTEAPEAAPAGATYWSLELTGYTPRNRHIHVLPVTTD